MKGFGEKCSTPSFLMQVRHCKFKKPEKFSKINVKGEISKYVLSNCVNTFRIE